MRIDEGPGGTGGPSRHGPRIVLHLGAHKTASTHLQRSLERHEGALARQGVLYMGPRHLRRAGLRLRQVIEGGEPPITWRRRIGRDVVALFADAETILVSDENILGSAHDPRVVREGVLYPDAAGRLDQLLRSFRARGVDLFLAVRDPAGFVVSAYGQFLLAGGRADFGAFLDGADITRLAWADLVARLLPVRGVTGCTVWRYEDYPACLPQIVAQMLPGGQGAGLVALEGRMQAGFSAQAHAQLRAWQAEGCAAPEGSTLAALARARFPKTGDTPAFAPFAEQVLARSAASYAADVARIRAMAGVRILMSGAPADGGQSQTGPDMAKDA